MQLYQVLRYVVSVTLSQDLKFTQVWGVKIIITSYSKLQCLKYFTMFTIFLELERTSQNLLQSLSGYH